MPNPPESDSPQPILVLAKRLDDCWERYRADLKRIRSDFADEYIHDLRISIRRLIAVIEMGRQLTQKRKLKKSRRLLKSYLDAFDALRDTQVQLAIVEEMQTDLPEVAVYRDRLRQNEKQQVSQLKKSIKAFNSASLSRQVTRLRTILLGNKALEAESATWSVLDDTYAVVIQRRSGIRPEDTETIHRTRVAFKKFRYQVEIVYSLLPNVPEDLLRRLHDYQAAMGEIQDAEVGLQMLDKFIAKSGEALEAVRTRFTEMHQARIAAFLSQINSLETFWRSAPGVQFPWEIQNLTSNV